MLSSAIFASPSGPFPHHTDEAACDQDKLYQTFLLFSLVDDSYHSLNVLNFRDKCTLYMAVLLKQSDKEAR